MWDTSVTTVMEISFLETRAFTQALPGFFEDDDAYRLFQESLLANPDRGDVMPGCGGLRKVRVYDKDRADDLTPDQRRTLTAAVARFREEIGRVGPYR